MKRNITTYIFLSVFVALMISAIIPYPLFSGNTNISSKHTESVNSFWESEEQNLSSNSSKIINLSWSNIDSLLDKSQTYTIFDVLTQTSFEIMRIGGKNHADVLPKNEIDKEIVLLLYENKHQCHPVLLKLNDRAFLPASFCSYPHGYQNHYCLHFVGSKTDGTNMTSQPHQKCVKQAQKATLPY